MNLLKSETEAIFNAPPPKKEEAPKNEPMSEEGKKEGDKATGETADAPASKADGDDKKDIEMERE